MKIIRTIFSIIGIGAIALVTAMAFKVPNSFKELFGIYEKKESDIQSVPYFVNFGDLGTSDSSYKTQYFKYANRSWYLAWGNHGGVDSSSDLGKFNMLVGWNSTKKPVYGSYSYVDEVMKDIPYDEGFNFSYLIMDFDFNLNHNLEWSFNPFENLSSTETKLYLISSHTQGQIWSIIDKIDDSKTLTKDAELKFTFKEESISSRTSRYGFVVVSKATSCRIEMNQFIISRLSVL